MNLRHELLLMFFFHDIIYHGMIYFFSCCYNITFSKKYLNHQKKCLQKNLTSRSPKNNGERGGGYEWQGGSSQGRGEKGKRNLRSKQVLNSQDLLGQTTRSCTHVSFFWDSSVQSKVSENSIKIERIRIHIITYTEYDNSNNFFRNSQNGRFQELRNLLEP